MSALRKRHLDTGACKQAGAMTDPTAASRRIAGATPAALLGTPDDERLPTMTFEGRKRDLQTSGRSLAARLSPQRICPANNPTWAAA